MCRGSDSIERAGLVAAVEQAADGIAIAGRTGNIQYLNPAFAAMTGFTREETARQYPGILESGLHPAAFYEELWNTIRGGRVWQGTLVNRRKDGTYYEQEMRIAPFKDSSGEVSGFILVKPEVTGRPRELAAQRLLAAVVEAAEDAIFACTPKGVMLTWNRGAEALFGYSAADTAGKNVSMLVPPERAAGLPQRVEKVLQGTGASQYEGVGLRQDGRKVPVSVSACPILDPEGQVAAVSVIMRDISERQEAERTRALLAAIVESSDDAIHAVTLDGTIVSWNRSAEALFGYTAREIVGKNVGIFAGPGRAGNAGEHLDTIRSGLPVSPFDTVIQRKDGCLRDVSLSLSPVRNPAGEVVGVSTIVRDIAERLRAERLLRENEERFQDMFEHAPFAMYLGEPDGHIVHANRAFCRMLGYSREELAAITWFDLTHPDDMEATRERAGKLRWEPGETIEAEKRCLHRTGAVVWVRFRLAVIRRGGGAGVYCILHVEDITQRKRTEEALRASEERFQDVFEHAPSGIYVAGRDRRIVEANEAVCRMLGYSREELKTKTWLDLTHPDDVPAAVERMKNLRWEAGECVEGEKRCLHRSGAVVWVRFKFSLTRQGGDAGLYSVVHVEDITERKRIEETLRSSEERRRMLARAIESADEYICITDAEDRILYVNQAFLRTYGYEERELIGQPIGMVRSPRTPMEAQNEILPATLAGEWCGELWTRSKEGKEFLVSLTRSVVYDESGQNVALVGIARDITERKQAEEALRRSREKFRQLAENMREVVWMVPLTAGEAPYVNPAYERVWERSCESVCHDPTAWMEAVHPDDLEEARRRFAAEMEGTPGQAEFRIRTPGGQEKWIWDRAYPIRDEAGRLIRLVGISEDITERKRFVTELIQAREDADAANLAKSRFLANMSHEIRTPMNGVLGMLQLLLDTDLTGEQRRYADVANTSGWSLLALIDGILDLSKIEAGKMQLDKLSFNPRRAIEDVVQLLGAQANAKGLDFRCRVSPDIPRVLRGDAQRLRQVLTNLCANAVKFTERGEIALDAALDGLDGGVATVRFAVTDTGIGIRPDQEASLFRPFVQVDASTTRKYGGTGLGLAISKQLVEMMGGSIGVVSREGRGSTFWFTAVFDVAAGRQAEASVGDGRSGALRASARAVRDARILVAEDEVTNREVALAQLHKMGYRANAVADGAAAVEALRHGGYDLVLMDCDMPVMDGFEATRRIRQSDHPAIPIVALTADAMPEDRDRCLSRGMNDYLAKPVDLDRLAEALARWLPASGAQDQAPDLFDEKALLWRLMGDRRLARIVLKGFLEDVPSHLDHLRRRLDGADRAGASSQAHALKGAAATVGAEDLHAVALEMERAGAAGRLDRCGQLLPRAVEEFERFRSALKRAGWA